MSNMRGEAVGPASITLYTDKAARVSLRVHWTYRLPSIPPPATRRTRA